MSKDNYTRQGGPAHSSDVKIVGEVTPAADATNSKGIEIDTTPVYATDALEHEAFMRQELKVFINDAQSENDPMFVEINVNGDYRLAVRGSEVMLRRYHVAVLAQAKQSRLRQRKVVQPDGSIGFAEDVVLALTYPFAVLEDPSPRKGGPWLKQMLSNPG